MNWLRKLVGGNKASDLRLKDPLLATLLEDWGWTGIKPKEIVVRNDFGNLLILDENEKVWQLLLSLPECVLIADSIEERNKIIGDQTFINEFELGDFGREIAENLGSLSEGQCYAMKTYAILGGEFEIDNFEKTDLEVSLSLGGQIANQIKDLPEGTPINFQLK